MLGWRWSSLAALDMDIWAVKSAGEAKEEETGKAEVQAMAKAEEEEEHKSIN